MNIFWGFTLRTFWEEQLAEQFGYLNFLLSRFFGRNSKKTPYTWYKYILELGRRGGLGRRGIKMCHSWQYLWQRGNNHLFGKFTKLCAKHIRLIRFASLTDLGVQSFIVCSKVSSNIAFPVNPSAARKSYLWSSMIIWYKV